MSNSFFNMDYKNMQLQKQLDQLEREKSLRPQRPDWESQLGPDGKIREGLQLKNNVDGRYIEQMREDALRAPGEQSAWRGLMDQQITREAGASSANLARTQGQAMDQMAMRGGVGAGAMERLMNQGTQQNLRNQQNIFGNRLQADLADEQNRISGLANLGSAEISFGNTQNTIDANNMVNTMREITQKRHNDANVYNKEMEVWAAEKTAAATPSSGGGKK